MTDLDPTEREDPGLQADPVLGFSDGLATFGQKSFSVIAAIVVILGTLYGLLHQGASPPSTAIVAFSGAIVPDTAAQAK